MVKEIETVRGRVVRSLPALAWIIGTVITLTAGCGGEEFAQLPAVPDDGGDSSSDVKPEGSAGSKPDAEAGVEAGDADASKIDAEASTDGDADAGCPQGQKLCSGECVAKDDPATGCAAVACDPCAVPHATATCGDAGACAIGACDEGFEDCDQSSANGCEGNLQNDPKNCKTCGNECPSATGTPVCESGVCGVSDCNAGQGDCDDDKANGCEVDLTTTTAHCGFCGNACDIPYASEKCESSACVVDVCDTGRGNCNSDHADGCEVDLTGTVAHCGACDTPCTVGGNAQPMCLDSKCTTQCDVPFRDCNKDVVDGCEIDTSTNALHCSACDTPCVLLHATPVCSSSQCAVGVCDTNWGDCDTLAASGCETDLQTTVAHCGGCNAPCPVPANATATCAGGTCGYTCNGTWQDCDGDATNGCEFDLASDPNHCGACGTVCTTANGTAGCSAGLCVIASCNLGWLNCDGEVATGCETNGLNNDAHCGQCNNACLLEHAAGDCVGGSCQYVCAHPWEDCSGAIDSCSINTDTDTQNCGACGTKCNHPNATEICDTGVCEITGCSGTYADCNGQVPDGCESNLMSDPGHCGVCTKACSYANANALCVGGGCVMGDCLGSFEDCDGNIVNGCESDTMTSLQHCGACLQPCALPHAAESCNSGTCTMGACEAGYTNCDNNTANGCEAQLASDPQNCGACGHDCLGGTCTAGKCDPFALATLQSTPWSIAVDATHVYWTNRAGSAGSVQRVPIAGGAVQPLASNQNDSDGLAINSNNVYWANVGGGTVNMTMKAGGGAITTVASGQLAPAGVAATDSIVVWTNWTGNSIWKANANGTGASVVTTTSVAQSLNPHRIATNGSHIWWTSWGNGRVRRVAVGGGAVTEIASSQDHPLGIAVDGTYAFWTNDYDAKVMRADVAGGGGVTTMATGQNKPSGVAVDASYVYFTSSDLGVVRRMLKNGSTIETLATGQGAPTFLAVDAVSVYWTNATGGTVMRLRLP